MRTAVRRLWPMLIAVCSVGVAAQGAPPSGTEPAAPPRGEQAGQDLVPAPAGDGRPGTPESRWYLERGTERRAARAADDVPEVAFELARLLRDGRVPGFYDGQFVGTADRFDELARLARDPSVEHNLRMMAIMALQEAADGEALAAVLEPLVMDADDEFRAEEDEWYDFGNTVSESFVRAVLDAELSRHARFALAKDGQPAKVLEKIAVMRRRVEPRRFAVLDPAYDSMKDHTVAWLRTVWFDVAYHYQQYDDYENASHWFQQLCDHLEGDETRWAHYNLACIAAIRGRLDEAMAELEGAVAAGFLDVAWLQEDGDLAALHDRADFQELIVRLGGDELDAAESDDDPNTQGVGP